MYKAYRFLSLCLSVWKLPQAESCDNHNSHFIYFPIFKDCGSVLPVGQFLKNSSFMYVGILCSWEDGNGKLLFQSGSLNRKSLIYIIQLCVYPLEGPPPGKVFLFHVVTGEVFIIKSFSIKSYALYSIFHRECLLNQVFFSKLTSFEQHPTADII